MSWRELAAPIIARVLQEMEGRPEKEVRAALREAYEVRRQLKLPPRARKGAAELHDQAVLSFLEERR